MKEISEKIRQIRKDKKLTQKSLSNRSGVSLRHIGYIENGKKEISLRYALKLAVGLETPFKEIIKDVEKELIEKK